MHFRRQTLPLLFAALLAAPGCASQPDGTGASGRMPARLSPDSDGATILSRDHRSETEFAGEHIRLLVWNVHKGRDDEWSGDFRTLSADSDLVLLQEAHLHHDFTELLTGSERWDLAEAWRWRQAATGVLTASSVAPLSVRALRHREPMLRTGKTALLTEYRLAGSARTLLVANVHAINFTVDTAAFATQLRAVAALLAAHDGPAILSGDLNTWRAERKRILHDIAGELGLAEVAFAGPRKQFGRYPLDHVFYRGLDLVDSDVPAVASSDHNPLRVTFRLPASIRTPPTQLALTEER